MAKHGAEHTTYHADEVALVEAVLVKHRGPERAVREVDLVAEVDLPERKVRAILAELDGERWLIGKVNRGAGVASGLFLATSAAEAASLSAEIRSKTTTLEARLRRRTEYAARLSAPARQLALGEVA